MTKPLDNKRLLDTFLEAGVERSSAIARLLNLNGTSQERIARELDCSQSTVALVIQEKRKGGPQALRVKPYLLEKLPGLSAEDIWPAQPDQKDAA